MNEIFNTASLAKLSRQELLALLADLQCQVANACDETSRAEIQAKLDSIRIALSL